MVQELPKSASALREPGLWHRIFGSDIEQHEAMVYAKAVESGGVVLTLRAEARRRAQGDGNSEPAQPGRCSGPRSRYRRHFQGNRCCDSGSGRSRGRSRTAVRPITSDLGKNEVIRLAEEHLDVGKRLVEQGTTRIRRFVTEKPVDAEVTLHEEHAEVVRRAITDPNYIQNIDWSDTTVEVLETAEEAVVSKSARVVEEVAVGKTGSDRIQTVHDTVRRQQVEVERVPTTNPKP